MAEILPIKAWRYHPRLTDQIEQLTSPLFDVVSVKQKEALYRNDLNSIHLSVPKGDDPGKEAKQTLEKWKKEGVIVQDIIPGIYVYYQYFSLPGEEEDYCRKGFICHIKAYEWEEKMILRHENTIAQAVDDRMDILKETAFQSSPTHGLYDDTDFILEKYMDEAISAPLYDIEDYQGVREVLGVIHDAKIIKEFLHTLKEKKIVLADGHHRYEGALAYKNWYNTSITAKKEWGGYQYHMMYLSNSCQKGLKILPTHRLFFNTQLNEENIMGKLNTYFDVKVVVDPQEIGDLNLNKPWSFGLIFKDAAYKISLKPEKFKEREDNTPEMVKQLDLEVLHYFFMEKVLGISRDLQRFSSSIAYERNLSRCHVQVRSGEADFAVVTKGVSMKEVREIAQNGFMMPQKSTFFYPKAVAGLLFSSIAEEDFKFPYQMFL
jgi:uncharacterized protein (DUF1015 family)